ncbi:hypothetical protein [Qipengyuania gelatinilytica]|uniref:Uncharacterized protein n=1 Tax=Qipengyuania gelatinilytica TaxID=2867231 RepID=A0ABX9A540_9SPHN|nr:hypothetical protein [Qipengyuania gelatinilytica]QZD96392.1 hypothetical protein K3136_06860 [Qipengyuania gelatinilytica]
MIRPLIASAALVLSFPVLAQEGEPAPEIPPLTLEQQTNFRCGVAFGLVAGGQDAGYERTLVYPAMEPRGEEFFVRVTAQIMEDTRFTHDVMNALVDRELASFQSEGFEAVEAIMPACLTLLDASGV